MDDDAALAAIAAAVHRCTRCRLHATRRVAVPGEGDPAARIVLLGEAPGGEEDRSGRPFVGRAGRLLDRALAAAAGLQRTDLFITNVVKCRPPENRAPRVDEVGACQVHLRAQLKALRPAVLVALGGVSLRALFPGTPRIRDVRGRRLVYEGVPVVVTYHPAAIRFGRERRGWLVEDLRRARDLAGASR